MKISNIQYNLLKPLKGTSADFCKYRAELIQAEMSTEKDNLYLTGTNMGHIRPDLNWNRESKYQK